MTVRGCSRISWPECSSLWTIGKFGTNTGELFAPTDLVIDEAAGDIFVTSSLTATVEALRGGAVIQ